MRLCRKLMEELSLDDLDPLFIDVKEKAPRIREWFLLTLKHNPVHMEIISKASGIKPRNIERFMHGRNKCMRYDHMLLLCEYIKTVWSIKG